MRRSIRNVLDRLDRRVAETEAVLSHLCAASALERIFGADRRWALVGGVVRDSLLSAEQLALTLLPYWADLDVATARLPDPEAPCIVSSDVEVAQNSFGGLKLHEPSLGDIDAWVVGIDSHRSSTERWLQCLGRTDFGLNAVAFIWPDCKVLIHERWTEDLARRVVEKVATDSPRREVQPLRAVALSLKMSRRIKKAGGFRLGSAARADLEWLCRLEGRDRWDTSFAYLKNKLACRRWPAAMVLELLAELARVDGATCFTEALGQKVNAWLQDPTFISSLNPDDVRILSNDIRSLVDTPG